MTSEIVSCYLYFWQAYLFNDYWEDIGTIKSFFDANLALTEQVGYTSKENYSMDYGCML